MGKKELRSIMIEKRRLLTTDEVLMASYNIAHYLFNHPFYIDSKVVFSYMPYNSEVDVNNINQAILNEGKKLLVPRVKNNTDMDAVQIKNLETDLITGHYNILEPYPHFNAADAMDIDLVIVPGLAFDLKGNRLGYGKGYYDRFLEKCRNKAFKIGLGYDFQVFDSIPSEAYDKRVDAVITEKRILII